MERIILIRPGATEYDSQGRITGTINLPLSEQGRQQVRQIAEQIADEEIVVVYASPCDAAMETAEVIARATGSRTKKSSKLHNLNLGLWQGKLIKEIRQTQPKLFRKWQEKPDTIRPPEGETLDEARVRVEAAIAKMRRKHKAGTIAIVTPEPLARLIRHFLSNTALGDLWEAECEQANWEVIDCSVAAL